MKGALRIASITLTNFKSWYGTHTIHFAEQGLACIVGANGSGKSNIIDALLFVFGWRAKQLRQDRLVDLIHYSDERPDFARVMICFSSSQKQFEVARTIRQAGSSIYELNGQKTTLEQIQQVLQSNGLDVAHNRFLILQGEVESIALMKPCGEDVLTQMMHVEGQNLARFQQICEANKLLSSPIAIYDQIQQILSNNSIDSGIKQQLSQLQPPSFTQQSDAGLLEFIEAVVGTQQYIPQLAQQMAVCEFLNEEKSQLRVKLSATVQHRDAMNEVKNEARDKILRIGTQIREEMQQQMNMASSGRVGIQECNTRIAESQAMVNQGQAELQQVEQQTQTARQRLESEQLRLNQAQLEFDQAQNNSKANDVALGCLTEKKTGLLGMLSDIKAEEQQLRADFVLLQQEHDTFPEQNMLINTQLQSIDNNLTKAQSELTDLNAEQAQHNEYQSQIQREILVIERTIQPIATDRARMQAQYNSFTRQVAQKLQVFVDAAFQTTQGLIAICNGFSYKNSRLTQLNNKIVQLKTETTGIDFQKLSVQTESLKQQEKTQQEKLENLNLLLRENEQQAHEFETSDKLLNALLRSQADGKLHGIHGRLGQLGKIDSSFNLAAIAAFGSQLDYIVCDNMDNIQMALSFIRQHDLGVASFIDLEQVGRRFQQQYRRPSTNAEFVEKLGGRIFLDLVSTQDMFLPAFWHVMQETAVCDEVKLAIQISKGNGQRIRVVTLNGELFERSGSLTGGGAANLQSRYKGFRQGAQTSDMGPVKRDIHSIETVLAQLSGQIQSLQRQIDKYTSTQEQIGTCQQNIQGLQFEIQAQKSKILLQIQELIKIDDNIIFKQYSASLNPMITEELGKLSLLLQQDQTAWEAEKYIQATPSIIELTQYYQQQRIADPDKFKEYIQKHDNVFLLESDESLIANIVQFSQPIANIFNFQQNNAILQQLHDVEQQEKALRQQIEDKQAYLDAQGTIGRFKQLKRDISELQRKRDDALVQLNQLKIKEAQYQQKHTELEQLIMDVEHRFESINMQLLQLADAIQAAEQERERMRQILSSADSQRQHCKMLVSQADSELCGHEQRAKMLQDNLKGLNSQIRQIQAQIDAFQRQILSSECQLVTALECLTYMNGELNRIQEAIQYQPPLFSSHSDVQELAQYDSYVIATYGECRKRAQLPSLTQLKATLGQDFSVVFEFSVRVQQLQQRQDEFQALSQLSDEQLNLLQQLRETRQNTFAAAFAAINEKLRQIYRIFSMGGDALLEFSNHFDPFEGVIFSVMPPKKAWRQICHLSGGEKTLSSLSLIFALHQYKYNIIYVVDEIDAALDFRNVSLIANYLKEQSMQCQFVVVSLRNNTFEVADRLIGVYKVRNCSRAAVLDIQ